MYYKKPSRKLKDVIADLNDGVHATQLGSSIFKIEYHDMDAIRYYDTDIVTFWGNKIILDSGGWKTGSTRNIMNEYLPNDINVYQSGSIWYVTTPINTSTFYDGMTIKHKKIISVRSDKKEKELLKKIDRMINKLREGSIPLPNNGDCLFCNIERTERLEGKLKRKEQFVQFKDCKRSHLDETYLHGSLVFNAMYWAGYTHDMILNWIYVMSNYDKIQHPFTTSLRRYLKANVGLAF